MERRTFVQSAVATASVAALPALSLGAVPMSSTRPWDFVIVGAGTAGLPAAVFASRRGARVLLIDAADDIGGTLHLANGQVSAGGSKLQACLARPSTACPRPWPTRRYKRWASCKRCRVTASR